MGVWTNHRTRQSGKYAKLAYQQQQAASMSVLPPPTPVYAQPAQAQPAAGFNEEYERGWREGQRDLVAAIQSGRLTWEEAVQRLT